MVKTFGNCRCHLLSGGPSIDLLASIIMSQLTHAVTSYMTMPFYDYETLYCNTAFNSSYGRAIESMFSLMIVRSICEQAFILLQSGKIPQKYPVHCQRYELVHVLFIFLREAIDRFTHIIHNSVFIHWDWRSQTNVPVSEQSPSADLLVPIFKSQRMHIEIMMPFLHGSDTTVQFEHNGEVF